MNNIIPDNKPEVKFIKRPWGHFKQYANNKETTVSLMQVKPGQRLSLQSHKNRAELWIVFDKNTKIQVDDNIAIYGPGDEVWIPANAKHRLSCAGDDAVRVLEVAFGNWVQEDIIRYDDDYKRPEKGE